MPGIFSPIGLPGPGTVVAAAHKHIFKGLWSQDLPGGKLIDGTVARDSTNTGYQNTLQPGLVMGKITTVVNSLGTVGYYANSIYGLTGGALTSAGTSLTLPSAAVGTEIVRRRGTTGTFKLTGPPTAAGTVRTLTATYSAISGTTATITALGVNEVQTFNFTNSPSGTFRLGIVDSSGVVQYTQRITYSATIGTLTSNLQTATDAVLATNAIVWSGTLVTAVAATFSGTGYTALPQTLIVVDTDALTAGDVDVTRTTTGVDGRFVTSSFIQPTDGTETPLTFIPDGYGIRIADDAANYAVVPFAEMPIAGFVETAQLINYPSDTSLKTWLKQQFYTNAYARFTFDDAF